MVGTIGELSLFLFHLQYLDVMGVVLLGRESLRLHSLGNKLVLLVGLLRFQIVRKQQTLG